VGGFEVVVTDMSVSCNFATMTTLFQKPKKGFSSSDKMYHRNQGAEVQHVSGDLLHLKCTRSGLRVGGGGDRLSIPGDLTTHNAQVWEVSLWHFLIGEIIQLFILCYLNL
jgi:hypothetical protein